MRRREKREFYRRLFSPTSRTSEHPMSIRNLDKIFRPRHVAVVGASDDPAGVSFSVLRNLLHSGFAGTVYPVNRKRESVQGTRAYTAVADLPQAPDLAVLCTPAVGIPALVRECGEA